ncbi:MAG TPA: cytochrome P450 [Pseudomonas sp.]
MATAKVNGELMIDYDLTGMLTVLLLAGLDTVASMMGLFARFFALNPAHRQKLIEDPGLISRAVEELLRRYPIANLARVATQDYEYHGVNFKAGDMVVAPTTLDGLDERRFTDPFNVDFHRDAQRNLTFGGGVHRCMGAMLARTELRLFIEEWFKRVPDFQIKPGADLKVSARSVATLTSLPLVWDPASTR